MTRFSCFLLMFLLVTLPLPLGAQASGTGALSGTVLDSSGALVPDAHVRVTNEGTGESRSAITTANGTYLVPLLPPGTYRVEVEKEGFKKTVQQGFEVVVRETNTLTTRLEVGANTQSV